MRTTSKTDLPEMALRIRELRKQHGLTQQGLADLLGIPKRTIESWEIGNREPAEYIVNLIQFRLEHEK